MRGNSFKCHSPITRITSIDPSFQDTATLSEVSWSVCLSARSQFPSLRAGKFRWRREVRSLGRPDVWALWMMGHATSWRCLPTGSSFPPPSVALNGGFLARSPAHIHAIPHTFVLSHAELQGRPKQTAMGKVCLLWVCSCTTSLFLRIGLEFVEPQKDSAELSRAVPPGTSSFLGAMVSFLHMTPNIRIQTAFCGSL